MIQVVRRYRQLPMFGPHEVEVADGSMTVIGVPLNEQWITEQGFTKAEHRVLELLIRQYTVQAIATTLGRKPTTIYTHVQSMVNKAGVPSVGDLIALATHKEARLETRIRAVS